MHISLQLASASMLVSALAAQVPVGAAINGSIGGSATPLIIVDRTPVVTTITGATLTNINALRIDPIDGSIWMVSHLLGEVRRGTVNFAARTFGSETVAATLPPAGLAAIAFDIDGNPVVAGGLLEGNGGLWRIGRAGGSPVQIVNSAAGLTGIANAIDEDPATGDLYFGVFGTGDVYRISPPYTLNSHVHVGTIATAINTSLSGISFARTAAAPGGILYLSAFAPSTNQSLSTMSLTGAVTPIAGTPPWYEANWVDYDAVRNDLWVVSTLDAHSISSSTTTGVNTVLHQIPPGAAPACIEVNDIDPAAAEVRVAPMRVPVPTAAVRLELAVAGKPGEVGILAIVSPALAVLGTGPIGANGLFTVSFPNVTVPAGTPNFITFMAGTVDTTLLSVKISPPVGWPRN
jgi:hypothetical protein